MPSKQQQGSTNPQPISGAPNTCRLRCNPWLRCSTHRHCYLQTTGLRQVPLPTQQLTPPSQPSLCWLQVELCGRAMHIGRPKGYVPPAPGEVVPDALPRSVREKQEQEKAAAAETGGVAPLAPTTTLLLTGILPAGQLRTESERRIVSRGGWGCLWTTVQSGLPHGVVARLPLLLLKLLWKHTLLWSVADCRRDAVLSAPPVARVLMHPSLPLAHPPQLQEEVYEEAAKYGNVSGVYVAIPTAQVQDLMPGRCYIKYGSVDDAKKGGQGTAGLGLVAKGSQADADGQGGSAPHAQAVADVACSLAAGM